MKYNGFISGMPQDSRKSSTSDERLAERVPVLEVLDATVARKSVSSLMVLAFVSLKDMLTLLCVDPYFSILLC